MTITKRKKQTRAKQKVALVTGAGRGLGAALALALGDQGYRVAVHHHHSARGAQRVVASIERRGGVAQTFAADLTSAVAAQEMGRMIHQQWGQIDVLINNAGVYEPRFLEEFTEEEWRRGLETTVSATYWITRSCLPALRKSRRGRIINIGDSLCQHTGFTEPAFSYYVGKVGVWMLTQTLAVQEAAHGLTVNCVSPGVLERSVPLSTVGTYPMKKGIAYEEVIHGINYLLSPQASKVTGTNLLIAGGWNIAPLFQTILEGNREALTSWCQPSKSPQKRN
jgi:NAD(P)-dependent dehydrogenase (short-subunit alcohol dehydrogenase family)